jgi:hypothetical protein
MRRENPWIGTAAHLKDVFESADELGPFFFVGPLGLLIGVVVSTLGCMLLTG